MHVRELAPEAWSEYLEAISKEFLGAPVSLQISTLPPPPGAAPAPLALQALGYDGDVDVFELSVARSGRDVRSVVQHLVDHPARIEVDTATMLAPMTIAVEGADGRRTVIEIGRAAELIG